MACKVYCCLSAGNQLCRATSGEGTTVCVPTYAVIVPRDAKRLRNAKQVQSLADLKEVRLVFIRSCWFLLFVSVSDRFRVDLIVGLH
eukprot:2143651-Pyramimonas_sp.AAC.1